MKHHGCHSEYKRERGLDIVRAYHQQISQLSHINTDNVFSIIVNLPSKRFWVSEERASFVIISILKGDKLLHMRPNRREMFFEIYRRFKQLKKLHPQKRLTELISIIIHSKAPRFYLTPDTAKLYFYQYKNEWNKIQQQKLSRFI